MFSQKKKWMQLFFKEITNLEIFAAVFLKTLGFRAFRKKFQRISFFPEKLIKFIGVQVGNFEVLDYPWVYASGIL